MQNQALRRTSKKSVTLILVIAALASIATSAPMWVVDRRESGPELLIDSQAPSASRHVTLRATNVDDAFADAKIAFTLAPSQPSPGIKAHIMLVPDDPDMSSPVELLANLDSGDPVSAVLDIYEPLACNNSCESGFTVVVSLEGDLSSTPDTSVSITWTVNAVFEGGGDTDPPSDAKFEILFD